MALYRPDYETEIAPADALAAAHRFVSQCRAWAREREIPRREEELQTEPPPVDHIAREKKLEAWRSYEAFLTHTLRELEDGTLDEWFEAEKK